MAQKAKAFLWIQGPWVLIAACFDHLSPKLLWMCLRANEQVLMLIFCSFCCCWIAGKLLVGMVLLSAAGQVRPGERRAVLDLAGNRLQP